MWYSLRKSIPSHRFLYVILAISVLCHAGFLAWFFFVFKDRASHVSFTVTPAMLNNEVEFVFHSVKQNRAPGQPKASGAVAQKKQKQTPKKSAKKLDMKTSIAQKPQPKKGAKKATSKKATKPVEKKKTESIKKAPEIAKPIPEKTVEPQKNAEPDVAKAIDPNPIPLSTNGSETIQQQIGIHEQGLIDEYIALQKEIVAQWAPPPGIARDAACLVTVVVDWQGATQSVTIEKSSGVLMYDASARASLAKIAMPRWAWGKTITIMFNQ